MDSKRRIVNCEETEQDDSGYVTMYQGVPFTGLSVELSADDEIISVEDLVEGRPHGYWVEYLGGRPTGVGEYDHGTRHGLAATWNDGRLTQAARSQYGIEDQRLLPDGTLKDLPEAAARIARIHATRRTHALLTESVSELLARFESKCDALLLEARHGLGLA